MDLEDEAGARREAVFTEIWRDNGWGGAESRSGPGSGVARTEPFRAALEAFLARVRPRLVYDAPCGDWCWMRHVRLPEGAAYLGADIVSPMIAELNARDARPGVAFTTADVVAADPPAEADVWLCRESLFHLTLADAVRVVERWRASKIEWFLATTTPTVGLNAEMTTGGWRRLNLALAPFPLGPPLEVLPDAAPADPAKVVGVWRRA
ncbi:class I SAM-dependent methyltransferase [Caulobacter sp. 17J65-9]|uniref:class I SAM-dependent methyltransferase n=1 Tax=Caulobacter sp. 17J65-9 TaxID=2709382 RepID=UPI0013CB957A|nr:class I SAM-dependent methyltransferase [Caulobacter sp. 17J65-9]NEX94363.1 class I SAM-dependent methyltransferase [Caulobacter sp. 17J65-9]